MTDEEALNTGLQTMLNELIKFYENYREKLAKDLEVNQEISTQMALEARVLEEIGLSTVSTLLNFIFRKYKNYNKHEVSLILFPFFQQLQKLSSVEVYMISVVKTDSMSPVIKPGDIIVAIPATLREVKKDNIISVCSACDLVDFKHSNYRYNRLIAGFTHRLVDIVDDGNTQFVYTKGDACKSIDGPRYGRCILAKVIKVIKPHNPAYSTIKSFLMEG